MWITCLDHKADWGKRVRADNWLYNGPMPPYRPPVRVRPSLKRLGTVVSPAKPAAKEVVKEQSKPVDFAKLVEIYEKLPGMLEEIETAKKGLLDAHAEVLKKASDVEKTFAAVKRGPQGMPGKEAPALDVEEVVRRVAAIIPKPVDGVTPVVDHKKIAKLAATYVELPAVENGKDADPESIMQKMIEMLGNGEIKIPIKTVEGLDNKFTEVHSRIPVEVERYGRNTWKRGGGDTVKAGTNVTIATDGNGQKVISATVAGLVPITVTGTINDSNKSFTAATQPTLLNINGAFYLKTGGAYTWSYSGTTITLNQPVGTGGSIFGI